MGYPEVRPDIVSAMVEVCGTLLGRRTNGQSSELTTEERRVIERRVERLLVVEEADAAYQPTSHHSNNGSDPDPEIIARDEALPDGVLPASEHTIDEHDVESLRKVGAPEWMIARAAALVE